MAEASRTEVTLGDVVAQAELELAPVVAGDPALLVRSAHTSEIDDAARWLEPDSILLTTGLRLVGAETSRAIAEGLVAGLRRARVVALFFGVGVNFAHVPATLVAACRAEGFPLYTVGAEVPFYRIENYINAAAGAPDAYQIRRVMGLTNDLLDSLSSEEPTKALILRLATICRGTAVLYSPSGRTIEATGPGPLQLMWAELQRRRREGPPFEIGLWTVMGQTVILRGSTYVLAIASRNSAIIHDLGHVLLDTTQRLLGAINAISRLAVSRQRHEGIQLLTEIQDGIPVARELRYWERLEPFHFHRYAPVRAVVARSQEEGGAQIGAQVQLLLEHAERNSLGLILAETGRSPADPPSLNALVADSTALSEWLELVGAEAAVGLSEPFTDLSLAPEAFGEAETAADIAAERLTHAGSHTSRSGSVVRLDDVDPASWLLARRRSQGDRVRVGRFADALRHDPEVLATVVRYLALDMDVARTASVLFVHGNTVRYRLRKAEHLLGSSMSNSATVANLYLALKQEIDEAEEG